MAQDTDREAAAEDEAKTAATAQAVVEASKTPEQREAEAEEQEQAEEQTAQSFQAGAATAAETGERPTDLYSRVNTAHGMGDDSIVKQNPNTFRDDIDRNGLPGAITDPRLDAQPVEVSDEERERSEDEANTRGTFGAVGSENTNMTPEDKVYRDKDVGGPEMALRAQAKNSMAAAEPQNTASQVGALHEGEGGTDKEKLSDDGITDDGALENPDDSAQADGGGEATGDKDLKNSDYDAETKESLRKRLEDRGEDAPASASKGDLWKQVTGRAHRG
jgi:hypothetical protein